MNKLHRNKKTGTKNDLLALPLRRTRWTSSRYWQCRKSAAQHRRYSAHSFWVLFQSKPSSDEIRNQFESLLRFYSILQEQPEEGSVCQKCWVKVSVFHEFYTHIECLHRANEEIFAECIVDEIKASVDSESDNWEFPPDEESFDKSFDEKPKIERRKTESTKSEHSSSDDNRLSSKKYELGSGEGRSRQSALRTENQQTPSIDDRPKKKRGRPRKGEQRKTEEAARVGSVAETPQELNINNEPMRKRGRPRKDDPVKPRSTKWADENSGRQNERIY